MCDPCRLTSQLVNEQGPNCGRGFSRSSFLGDLEWLGQGRFKLSLLPRTGADDEGLQSARVTPASALVDGGGLGPNPGKDPTLMSERSADIGRSIQRQAEHRFTSGHEEVPPPGGAEDRGDAVGIDQGRADAGSCLTRQPPCFGLGRRLRSCSRSSRPTSGVEAYYRAIELPATVDMRARRSKTQEPDREWRSTKK